jgi:hypothetical protein
MRRFTAIVGLVFAALTTSIPSPATAQGWTLDAYAGRAMYDQVSAGLGTSNGVLGIRYAGESGGWFFLSAAAPLQAADPFWAATGLGRRLSIGTTRFLAGADLGAHGHGYRDPTLEEFGAGATFSALPFVALAAADARVEMRSGLLQYTGTFSGETQSRLLHETGVRLILQAVPQVTLTAETKYTRAEEANYPYAGGWASVDHGAGEVWASAGRWFSESLPDVSWSAGASLRLGQRFELWASVRDESSDPLYWNGSRQSWNVGVSRRLGKVAVPRSSIPVQIAAGQVTIRIPRAEVKGVPFVAGDFTEWQPVAMVRSGEFWTASFALDPGHYSYAFRTTGGDWFVPASVQGRRPDGFGGFVATLTVP